MNWQPMGLLGRTINGYTLLIVPSRQNQKVSFMLLLPLSSCMYVEGVKVKGWRNLHSQPFLKHDAEWEAECTSNLYFNNVSRMQLFPQNGSDSNAQPPFMWYKNVYAAMSSLAWESEMMVSGWWFLYPCSPNNSIFPSLQRLVDNVCNGYGLLTVLTEHDVPSDIIA